MLDRTREAIVELPANPSCVLVQMQATTLSETAVYRRMRRYSLSEVAVAQIASVPQDVVALLDQVPPIALESTQLQLVHSGSLILDQDGELTRFSAGDVAVYDASRPFTFHYPEEFRTSIVQVPVQVLGGIGPDGVGVRWSGRPYAIRAATTSVGRRLLGDELRSMSAAHGVRMIEAARLLLAEHASVQRLDRMLPGHLVAAVREHVREHLADPHLSAATIAARFHVSLRTLFAAFEHEDESLGSLVRRVRLDAARPLLRDTGLSVAEVAGSVGYADTTAFIRAWRADTGSTPGRWRRTEV
ncbi:helix-turn-helix domain-containing protein [Cnuibacter sp. UC19_7]|uniref:helix-turn-helix domain-containing protein n=1 Tax=Cnuibacter sp. UC19_7 TaxID=3350166 RepID=UPI0036727F3A